MKLSNYYVVACDVLCNPIETLIRLWGHINWNIFTSITSAMQPATTPRGSARNEIELSWSLAKLSDVLRAIHGSLRKHVTNGNIAWHLQPSSSSSLSHWCYWCTDLTVRPPKILAREQCAYKIPAYIRTIGVFRERGKMREINNSDHRERTVRDDDSQTSRDVFLYGGRGGR